MFRTCRHCIWRLCFVWLWMRIFLIRFSSPKYCIYALFNKFVIGEYFEFPVMETRGNNRCKILSFKILLVELSILSQESFEWKNIKGRKASPKTNKGTEPYSEGYFQQPPAVRFQAPTTEDIRHTTQTAIEERSQKFDLSTGLYVFRPRSSRQHHLIFTWNSVVILPTGWKCKQITRVLSCSERNWKGLHLPSTSEPN